MPFTENQIKPNIYYENFCKMICPVCQHSPIPFLATICPSCNASLLGIKLLDALEEQYVETVKVKVALEGELIQKKIEYQQVLKKKNSRINYLLFLLFLLPMFYYFFGRSEPKTITAPNTQMTDTLDRYKQELAEKVLILEDLNRQLVTIQHTQHVREIQYVVKKGDRLYDLGILFYNDTTAWYQIALDNKIYDIKGLPIGDTLTIKYRD